MTTTYADIRTGDRVSTVAQPGDAFYNVVRPVHTVQSVEVDGIFVDITCDSGLSYSGTVDSVLTVHTSA